jgi:methyl-accepting chemotaxis protein
MAVSGLSMAVLQSEPLSGSDIHWLMIFAGVIAAAMIAQAAGLIVSAIFAAKMATKVGALGDSLDQKATPVLAKANAMLDDLGPKVRSISTNVDEISYTVRAKVEEVGETVTQVNRTVAEANVRTRMQIVRADDLVTEAMDTAAEVSEIVQDGIRTPARQIAGIVAGVKAGLETLIAKSPFFKPKNSPFDF